MLCFMDSLSWTCLVTELNRTELIYGNPLQYFLPGESQRQKSLVGYTVHGVSKSWTQLSD